MKKFGTFAFATLAALALTSCFGNNESKEQEEKVDFAGTYAAVKMNESIAPMVVILSEDGSYRFVEKKLGLCPALAVEGAIEWVNDEATGEKKFTLVDREGQTRSFILSEGAIVTDTPDSVTLTKSTPEEAFLASDLTSVVFKPVEGDDVVVNITKKDGVQTLKVAGQNGKSYTLKGIENGIATYLAEDGGSFIINKNSKTATVTDGEKSVEQMLLTPLDLQYNGYEDKENIATHNVTFVNTLERNYAILSDLSGFAYILPQVEAWANGAKYGNEEISLESKGDQILLTVDGHQVTLKQLK